MEYKQTPLILDDEIRDRNVYQDDKMQRMNSKINIIISA